MFTFYWENKFLIVKTGFEELKKRDKLECRHFGLLVVIYKTPKDKNRTHVWRIIKAVSAPRIPTKFLSEEKNDIEGMALAFFQNSPRILLSSVPLKKF